MVSHLIYFIKTFYKFCTFNAISKDNAAINCIIVQHKKGSFPSTLTDHTTRLLMKLLINLKLANGLGVVVHGRKGFLTSSPTDFSVWGFVNDGVFLSFMPNSIAAFS
jgi:hypothetical protein